MTFKVVLVRKLMDVSTGRVRAVFKVVVENAD